MYMNKTIEQRMEELENRVAVLEGIPSQGAMPSALKSKKMSAKEFLITKEPKTDTQKTLALAFHLEHIEGMKSFNATDIEVIFHSAKEKLPININDAVNKNIARGFIMEAQEKKDAKKAWVLTTTGEKFVENDFKTS